jgi:hypothetical protein
MMVGVWLEILTQLPVLFQTFPKTNPLGSAARRATIALTQLRLRIFAGPYLDFLAALRRIDRLNTLYLRLVRHVEGGPVESRLEGLDCWQPCWQALSRAADRLLAADHPLRPLLDLGLSVGKARYSIVGPSVSNPTGGYRPPDLSPILSTAGRLPTNIRVKSRRLDWLVSWARSRDAADWEDLIKDFYTERGRRIGRAPSPADLALESAQVDDILDRLARDIPRGLKEVSDVEYELARSREATSQSGGVRARETPRWDRDLGLLTFRNVVVRKVRGGGVAKNIRAVLDTFQDDGWPDRIDNPLSGGRAEASARKNEAINTLNDHVVDYSIRFKADGTGEGILWEEATD